MCFSRTPIWMCHLLAPRALFMCAGRGQKGDFCTLFFFIMVHQRYRPLEVTLAELLAFCDVVVESQFSHRRDVILFLLFSFRCWLVGIS